MTTPRRRSARNAAPRPVAETYQIGEWAGYPNYGCPYCPFATLEGTALVVAHLAEVHREQLSQAPQEV